MKKQKHAVELLKTNYQLVGVSFDESQRRGYASANKNYVYKAPLDLKIKIGDSLVVLTTNRDTGDQLKFVTVKSIDDVLDEDSVFPKYKWIVDTREAVMHNHKHYSDEDAKVVEALRKMDAALARAEFKEKFQTALGELTEKDKQLIKSLIK